MPANRFFVLLSGRQVLRSSGALSVLACIAGCNGPTAFVESSRLLERKVTVAVNDADARARRADIRTGESESIEPVAGKSRPSGSDVSGWPEDNVPSHNHSDGLSPVGGEMPDPAADRPPVSLPADGSANGIDEQRRNFPADPDPNPSPQDTVPHPDPVADAPAIPPSVPHQPSPAPVASPAPKGPRAGDTVNVQMTQPRAKVDVLWVVDSSGSMAWAQNQLKSKFQSFAQRLKETRIDFQVGVTSLDVCQVDSTTGYAIPDALCPSAAYISEGVKTGGKIVGPLRGTLQTDPVSKRTILRDTADFIEAFQRTAMLGTKGSAMEHGLWAAKLAVEKSLQKTAENQGFIRADAALSVVVLSDEEDDSVQMWCEDAYGRTSLDADGKKDLNLCREGGRSPFLDAFGIAPYALMKTSKGSPVTTHRFTADQFKSWAAGSTIKGTGNFRVSAITGLRSQSGAIDCKLSGGPEESGTNYIKAAQLTGGAVENICSSDWSSVLTNIGQNTVELATRVSLPAGRLPFAGTLQVTVDGQVLDAMHYTYDSSVHAVVFKVPPAMGSEVAVSYRETIED